MAPLEIRQVSKSYGLLKAIRDISFSVNEKEIFGLIGPDGAGKTTLMRIVVTLLGMDTGTVHFKARDISQNTQYVRSNVGYMPQRFSLYQDLSVEENLNFFGDLFKVPKYIQEKRKERLFEFSRLKPFRMRAAGALSGGMKQKLALSCMLMHEPDVIVLDEPTFGVDPLSRHEFWEILHGLAEKGVTILVSTPYMEEAAECTRVGLMFEGELLGVETPDQFIQDFSYALYLLKTLSPHTVYQKLQKTELHQDIQLFGEGLHVTDRKNRGAQALEDFLKDNDIQIESIEQISPQLEDVFLNLLSHREVS